MYRADKANITIDNNRLDYKTSGTILGPKINTRRIIPQSHNSAKGNEKPPAVLQNFSDSKISLKETNLNYTNPQYSAV